MVDCRLSGLSGCLSRLRCLMPIAPSCLRLDPSRPCHLSAAPGFPSNSRPHRSPTPPLAYGDTSRPPFRLRRRPGFACESCLVGLPCGGPFRLPCTRAADQSVMLWNDADLTWVLQKTLSLLSVDHKTCSRRWGNHRKLYDQVHRESREYGVWSTED